MNINCIICSDLFTPAAEIYTTTCGHIFHYTCLIQWIERSKTCPQCRCKATEKTIHRVYFNLTNTEGIVEDASTLQFKVDTLQFQLKLKEKDVQIYTEKYRKAKEQNAGLRTEVKEVESRKASLESAIHALKEQVSYFKLKAKENERLNNEITHLKERLKEVQHVQTAIDGTRDQVNDMLRHNRDPVALGLLVTTLKRELVEAGKRHQLTMTNMRQEQSNSAAYRKDLNEIKSENNKLKSDLESHENCGKQIHYLKRELENLAVKLRKNDFSSSESLNRIVKESPICLRQFKHLDTSCDEINLNKVESPSIAERVQTITDSNSPYLTLKSSNVGLACLVNTRFTTSSQSTSQRNPNTNFNICKQVPTTVENNKSSVHSYDGLGGHSKEETFPSFKPIIGVKRQKSSTTISSMKFRKLAPNKKLKEYFSKNNHE